MPRAPDWLLGFGFSARDRGLTRYLDDMQQKLSSLAEGFSNVEASARGLRASSTDLQKFSEAVKKIEVPEPPRMTERTFFRRDPKAAARVTPFDLSEVEDLQQVLRRTLKEVGLSSQKISSVMRRPVNAIAEFFDEIEDGAIVSSDTLSMLIAAMEKLPKLPPRIVKKFSTIREELGRQAIGSEEAARRLSSYEEEIIKAAEETKQFGRLSKKHTRDVKEFFENIESAAAGVEAFLTPLSEADINRSIARGIVGTLTASWKVLSGLGKGVARLFGRTPFFERLFGKKRAVKEAKKSVTEALSDTPEQIKEIERETEKVDPITPIEDSFLSLKETIRTQITPGIAKELGDMLGVIDRTRTEGSKEIAGFGQDLTRSIFKMRDDIGEVFPDIARQMDTSFERMIDTKEGFVEIVVDNFRQMASRVGDNISKMSVNVRREFVEMETVITEPLQRMTARTRRFRQEIDMLGGAFSSFRARLDREVEPLTQNLEAIGQSLKKAVGLNPAPIIAVLARLAPALARLGPIAARGGARGLFGRLGVGAAGRGAAARGVAARGAARETFRQRVERFITEKAEERLVEEAERRIEQLLEEMEEDDRPRRRKRGGGGGTIGNPEPVPSIVEAISSMSSSMSSKLSRLEKVAARPPRAKPLEGSLRVESDELQRSFSASAKTERGLSGFSR